MILALLFCLQDPVEMKEFGSSYLVRVPSGYEETRSWPVILDLHGPGGAKAARRALAGWSGLADRDGFLVAAPIAPKGVWAKRADDAAFVRACLTDLKTRRWVDPERVLLAGFSTGADLALELAADAPERFAGCAPLMPTGSRKVDDGSPSFFTLGSEDDHRKKGRELAEHLEGKGLDVRVNLLLGVGHARPPAVALENVLGWFGEKAHARRDLVAAAKFMKARRYLDASLVLLGLMDKPELKNSVRWELNRIEAHGLFELSKVEVAFVNRRYVDAYLRCRTAAAQCAWVPVGERLKVRLAKLASDWRVQRDLKRRE